MKILVTGSKGFVGSYLMRRIDAVSYDLKEGRDIRNLKQLNRFMKNVDIVVHLAAFTSIKHAWENPSELYSHNILGTANVIESAIKNGVQKIVWASSASVYQPYDNPYSYSKYVCEGLFKIRKIPSIGLRFMNIYGQGQNPSYGTVIPSFIKGIKKGQIFIYGDGKQTRDFIFVDDIIDAILCATQTDKDIPVMDIGTGKSISILKTADILEKLIGKRVKRTFLTGRAEVRHSKANTKKARQMGFRSLIDFEDGLQTML